MQPRKLKAKRNNQRDQQHPQAVGRGDQLGLRAAPITHCPALRSGVRLAVGAPSMDSAAVATSGPIIHGSEVASCTQTKAASKAVSRVKTTRTEFKGISRGAKQNFKSHISITA